MTLDEGSNIAAALLQIPCGLFVLTAAHEGARSGVLTKWVQPCSVEPRLVMVAVPGGSPVEPLIRDSRNFALCQISAGDRLLHRRFLTPPDRGEDPFVTLPTHCAPSGSPIIDRALSYLDCEVVRHIDLDTDHRLYVGQVHHGAVLKQGARPAVEVGGNGLITPGLDMPLSNSDPSDTPNDNSVR
jgi:flavin reductase (DIM6/NTAB) family NADH-FMN oxidoreductase RutF